MVSIVRKILSKGDFFRNVATLISGSMVAQIIPIIVTPILTRIYFPEDFGVFSLFLAISAIMSVTVSGCYELAINLPKEDKEAFHLFALAILLAFISSSFLMGILLIWNGAILDQLGKPEMAPYVYLVPISIFLMSAYQSLSYWTNRKKRYTTLAINRVVQSGSTGMIQITQSLLFNMGRSGLVIGDITGRFISTFLLLITMVRQEKHRFTSVSIDEILHVAKKYQNFPKFTIISRWLDVSSTYLPLLFLDVFFGNGITGLYALADRALRAPISSISSSISEVFRQKAAEIYSHSGNCKNIYVSTFKRLSQLSCMIFIPLFLLCPYLFAFIFGQNWEEAGEMGQILIPMLAFGFVTSPLTAMFFIAEKQKLDLLFKVFLVLGNVLSLLIGYLIGNHYASILFLSIFNCLWYLVNLIFTYSLAKGDSRKGRVSLIFGSNNRENPNF